MAGVKALRKIQLGDESPAGTAVAASTIWRGLGAIEDQREVVFAEEDVGVLPGVDRTYTPKLLAALAMEETEATFEQLPYILEAGVKSVSGVKDGDGSGYAYTFAFPTTAANTPLTYTIEMGDNQAVEEMEYSFVQEFTLSGAVGEALKMSATWVGRQVSTSSFTGALSIPTVEEILFQKGVLYIDDTGGSIGDGLVSNSLIAMSLNVTTGFVPLFAADGELYFSVHKQVAPEVTLDLTFEHDATAVAAKVDWRAETTQLIRLLFQGTALETAGTTYTYKTLNIDLAGKWKMIDAIGDQDGNDVVTGHLRARYSSADTLFAEVIVVNELSALP